MNVTLLGTGCPAVDTVRYGPAQIICHDGQAVLVDCGSGVSQRLLAAGVPVCRGAMWTRCCSPISIPIASSICSSW